jgi:hypothetical protein
MYVYPTVYAYVHRSIERRGDVCVSNCIRIRTPIDREARRCMCIQLYTHTYTDRSIERRGDVCVSNCIRIRTPHVFGQTPRRVRRRTRPSRRTCGCIVQGMYFKYGYTVGFTYVRTYVWTDGAVRCGAVRCGAAHRRRTRRPRRTRRGRIESNRSYSILFNSIVFHAWAASYATPYAKATAQAKGWNSACRRRRRRHPHRLVHDARTTRGLVDVGPITIDGRAKDHV